MPKKYHAPKPEKPTRATHNKLYVDNLDVIEEAKLWLATGDKEEYEALMSVSTEFSRHMTLKELLKACEQLPAYPDNPEDIQIYIDDGDEYTRASMQIWTDLPDETDEDFNKRLKQYELELAEWTTKEALYQEEQKAKKVLELEEKVKKLKKES